MESKQEKYYKFITDDLVRKSDIMYIENGADPNCNLLVLTPWSGSVCWNELSETYSLLNYCVKIYGMSEEERYALMGIMTNYRKIMKSKVELPNG